MKEQPCATTIASPDAEFEFAAAIEHFHQNDIAQHVGHVARRHLGMGGIGPGAAHALPKIEPLARDRVLHFAGRDALRHHRAFARPGFGLGCGHGNPP